MRNFFFYYTYSFNGVHVSSRPSFHHLMCHWRLFSHSCARNRRFIALFTPIHVAISATPNNLGWLRTTLTVVQFGRLARHFIHTSFTFSLPYKGRGERLCPLIISTSTSYTTVSNRLCTVTTNTTSAHIGGE